MSSFEQPSRKVYKMISVEKKILISNLIVNSVWILVVALEH